MDPSLPSAGDADPPLHAAAVAEADADPLWDWDHFLDFDFADETLVFPWDAAPQPPPPPQPLPPAEVLVGESGSRVRKRDPRLVCPNFLAGRVPCACPEMDAIAAAEAEEVDAELAPAVNAKKRRTRVRRVGIEVRCQVVGCEVDIRELKGYHRRHRVCLRCANASSLNIDGVPKRYCQQCGKFHVLSDFDEGKRSCRRKLERHNKRRRRRPDTKSVTNEHNDTQPDLYAEVTFDNEQREENSIKVTTCDSEEAVVSNKVVDREAPICCDDGDSSPTCTLPGSHNDQSNSIASTDACAEGFVDEKIENAKITHSPSFNQKIGYCSAYPTGRISFKLYDWNPAEFPRRLRNQVLQWLGNMPIELEGYIRPGCTILTIFIAMPQAIWDKLSQDSEHHLRKLVASPNSLLMGKGQLYVYLCNRMFKIMEDGTSLRSITIDLRSPKIHYVRPLYVDVGKPIELVVCGSYLDQPKFKSLVSFNGSYLNHNSTCVSCLHSSAATEEHLPCPNHEIFKLRVTHASGNLFGPAFIEVENVSGLSNFVPVLFGNEQICSELERLEDILYNPLNDVTKSLDFLASCEFFSQKQNLMSALLLDIAWIMRPCPEASSFFNSVNIKRLSCLLEFLMQNEFLSVLEMILQYLDNHIGHEVISNLEKGELNEDVILFLKYVSHARKVVLHCGRTELLMEQHATFSIEDASVTNSNFPSFSLRKGIETECQDNVCSASTTQEEDEHISLLTESMQIKCSHPVTTNLGDQSIIGLPAGAMRTRIVLMVIVAAVLCLAACVVILHPRHRVESYVSVKRCLFGGTNGS